MSTWWRPAQTCAQRGGSCVVQYDIQRMWLWCIRCHDPKLSEEQLDRWGVDAWPNLRR